MTRLDQLRCGGVLMLVLAGSATTAGAPATHPDVRIFIQAASADEERARGALRELSSAWRDAYTPMIIDMVRLMPAPGGRARDDPGSPIRRRLIRFLERKTGKRFGDDLDRWRRWMWTLEGAPHPDYAIFKGGVYGNIDPAFREFFPPGVATTVRLEQIDWGGIRVGGIPALDQPDHVSVRDAAFMKDKHVVFGVVVGAESRAYPKRILAWHELARDRLGGEELAIVYCTLCGTVIPFGATVDGRRFTFDTSGLLYRSNKLLFDVETKSLWSSTYGEPVVGPLVGENLELTRHPVVTTTWGEWKAMHPDTTVLSLETGFVRDYREGKAYRDYFASDRLMFAVPTSDDRLRNKAEVLVIRPGPGRPLAIDTRLLDARRLFELERDGRRMVVVTTRGGANRVYDAGAVRFERLIDDRSLEDVEGNVWSLTEAALVGRDRDSQRLARIPAHRSFWFGIHAQEPGIELIR